MWRVGNPLCSILGGTLACDVIQSLTLTFLCLFESSMVGVDSREVINSCLNLVKNRAMGVLKYCIRWYGGVEDDLELLKYEIGL